MATETKPAHIHHYYFQEYVEDCVGLFCCPCGAKWYGATTYAASIVKRAEWMNKGIMLKPRPTSIVPVRPVDSKDRIALHDYYQANREAIIADFREFGAPATRKHWHLNFGNWYNLLNRWGLK